MNEIEFLQAELQRLAALASEYELRYYRTLEACRGHQRGLERAVRRANRLESELALERAMKNGQLGRLWSENASLKNKVERLSLKLMQFWNQGGDDAAQA
jgi:hypothetical protein